MKFDPTTVRPHFPALAGPAAAAHFDGPGGTQTPTPVASAIAEALVLPVANRGVVTEAERNADGIVASARAAMGDLLNADPAGIIFGRSMTQLTFSMAGTLAQTWRPGDEVIVTRLDHDANIRPWVIAADRAGATVRWAEFDPATGELPVEAVTGLLTDRTRLVAVTAASNLIGTMPDVPAITAAARSAGALSYVDAVHYTAHESMDLPALGADFLACSPYKFCGPHLGVLAARPALLEGLQPDKLLPSTDAVPERFELGTLPYELLAGTTAAVDFLAGMLHHDDPAAASGSRRDFLRGTLDDEPEEVPEGARRAVTDRRHRLERALHAMAEHELTLRTRIEHALADLGATVFSRAARRTPTLLFELPGIPSPEVYAGLAAHGVNAPAGNFYALECSRTLGLGDAGAVRVGLAPYSDDSDVDRLITGLNAVAHAARVGG
ncbi:cysteine desulfurase-like protein [Granulicoccus sp. GXG6511]|uniref:cysteine desulfurase-like protein n=1 Tax=Granulicoccus sp. GXG6511 TaxID=3381351 RepID=UPI003D7C758C